MRRVAFFAGLMLMTLAFFACKKEEDGTAQLKVYLTDAPGNFEHVFIDIQEVRIHSNNGGWASLPINAGVYDLLEFNNGMDTLLCNVELPVGRISQIRLVLGNSNSVVVDGTTHSLTTPSAQTSGLKLNLHQELEANESYSIWLDFDAGSSVVLTGNGEYILKPVIRTFSDLTNGKIKGIVTPMNAIPTVYAIQNGDTLTAIPDNNGFFMFCGVNGTYDVHVVPSVTGYSTAEVNGVQASFGIITDLGTIQIPN